MVNYIMKIARLKIFDKINYDSFQKAFYRDRSIF